MATDIELDAPGAGGGTGAGGGGIPKQYLIIGGIVVAGALVLVLQSRKSSNASATGPLVNIGGALSSISQNQLTEAGILSGQRAMLQDVAAGVGAVNQHVTDENATALSYYLMLQNAIGSWGQGNALQGTQYYESLLQSLQAIYGQNQHAPPPPPTGDSTLVGF